jgi:hypothetical protein
MLPAAALPGAWRSAERGCGDFVIEERFRHGRRHKSVSLILLYAKFLYYSRIPYTTQGPFKAKTRVRFPLALPNLFHCSSFRRFPSAY